jgi:hypothetical protein
LYGAYRVRAVNGRLADGTQIARRTAADVVGRLDE